MPTQTPVTTPTRTTPAIEPAEQPWQEQFTDPNEVCDAQKQELASPDCAP